MKKTITTLCLLFLCIGLNNSNIFAQDTLLPYYNVIDSINEKYHSDLYILSEEEFKNSPISSYFNDDYSLYINTILSTDINEFENMCLEIVNIDDTIDTNAQNTVLSTSTTKTVKFYNGNNSMTLTYKYSGSKFDTSYKPTASVKKINSTNYFVMSSYTGSFKNSNTTYSVVAKGKIYTLSGIVSNKSFTVNFNL